MIVKISSCESKFTEKFENGIYPGVIVGIRYGESPNDKGFMREANCFIVAVSDDEGNICVKSSKDFSCATFSPSGNFAKTISNIMKCPNTENDIASTLKELGWLTNDGLDMANFLGLSVNVTIRGSVSKKDSSKVYFNVDQLDKATARVGKLALPESGLVPSFYKTPYHGSYKASEFAPGWTWRDDERSVDRSVESDTKQADLNDLEPEVIPF